MRSEPATPVSHSTQLLALALFLISSTTSQASAQSNPFTGSKACYACHANIYQSFQKTDMGRSMAPANDWTASSLPSEASFTQPGTGRVFRVFHDTSGWHQSEAQQGVFNVEHPLDYAIGSGANGLTFLILRGEFLFQAPLSFYSKTGKWDFSPGYEHVDLGFNRMAPEECIGCHAGRSSPAPGKPGAFGDPPFQELSIGCENCHGAGREHVASAGKRHDSIVNPAKLAPRLAENICMNCHQTGHLRVLQPGKHYSDFRPGQWLFDTVAIVKQPSDGSNQDSDLLNHFSAMRSSRCFRESGGNLSCFTCHDPHVQPAKAETPRYFRAKCLTCHTEQNCALPLKARLANTPPDDCAGCHMPKREVVQVEHSALTNHTIPARAGEPVRPADQHDISGLVVVDAPEGRSVQFSDITLLQAYGKLSAQNPDFRARYLALLQTLGHQHADNPLVQQALGHKAFLEQQFDEAVAQLKPALRLNDPAIYLELAQAEAKLGRNEEAIQYLRTGVQLDPYDPVMQKTLILQYIQSKAYPEAQQRLEQYVQTFPEDSFMRTMLARVTGSKYQ